MLFLILVTVFPCLPCVFLHTVHFNYVPSVLELELCMGWKCTWCLVAMNFGFISSYAFTF